MLNYMELYDLWSKQQLEDSALTAELQSINGNEKEIEDRFYCDLTFGTAGLRGVLGVGNNRMNIYTIRRSTQGLAQYLNKVYKNATVAIAYDSRINGELFAKESASVLAANGIKSFLYSELMPTPALSYAVRELKCSGGINVTASHNPAKYNGYKVYDETGCQITAQMADEVMSNILTLDIFAGAKYMPFDEAVSKGLVEYISEEVVQKFINRVLEEQINPNICKDAGLKLVFTPLNGAGRRCVLTALDKMGIKDITVVKEQEMPDGNFPTCPYPNPEITEALQLGLNLVEELQADLLLATDPDCDRVGTAVIENGKPRLISGNEMGVLLLDYIARSKIAAGNMPKDPVCVKSLVSTTMADAVAKEYGIQMVNVLTGFKYIGDFIAGLEKQGKEDSFLLGFEESYGYLSGGYVRDKDAVNGSALICEMAAWYKAQGKHLGQALDELYAKFGHYLNIVDSYTFEGSDGMAKMASILDNLRATPPTKLADFAVTGSLDYKTHVSVIDSTTTTIDLPSANVLEYRLSDGSSVIVRPSGTEPKLKLYYSVTAPTKEQTAKVQKQLNEAICTLLGL